MINQAARQLAAWSAHTYPLALHVYPTAFRREFGESMAQAFRDQTREACRTSGLAGLIVLWIRTAFDVVAGALGAYAREPRHAMFRAVAGVGLLYVVILASAIGYAAVRFGQFYDPPGFSHFAAPGLHETDLMAGYDRALGASFGQYKFFVEGAALVVAILLGLAAALFGLWQKNLLHSAGALLAGTALTIVAFEFMPAIWFPFDEYAVGALFLFGGVPVAVGTCLLATAIGRFGGSGRTATQN